MTSIIEPGNEPTECYQMQYRDGCVTHVRSDWFSSRPARHNGTPRSSVPVIAPSAKVRNQKRDIPEGGEEYDILHRRYYPEELKKLGIDLSS
ncbi:MAG: hypothetical protein WB676_28690 [Bryobacteraceae bacterium]